MPLKKYSHAKFLRHPTWYDNNPEVKKIGFLPNCSHVSTIVWVTHFKKTPAEKARQELNKDAACFFIQIWK